MPQLWTETIVTQYFWLVVILLGFYFIAVVKFIPQIAFTLKARRILEAAGSDKKDASDANNELNTSSDAKLLLSSILAPKVNSPTSNSDKSEALKSNITTIRANWISKNI